MITIEKRGRFGVITSDVAPKLESMLYTKLAYTRKNAHFYANPLWAVVHFYQKKKKRFAWGLIDYVEKILIAWRDYSAELYEIKKNNTLIQNYNYIKDPVMRDTLRNYQIEAINSLINNDGNGLICVPTGAGKTFIAKCFLNSIEYKNVLILVPTTDLKNQWQNEFIKNSVVQTTQYMMRHVELLQQFDNVIFDECLHGATKIRLPDNTVKKIKDIVNEQKIKEVLSYNEEKKIFESKKILRYLKQPMQESWYELTIQDTENNIHKIKTTHNHKIWTLNGYKTVEQLTKNDILKVYLEPVLYKCNECNKYYNSKNKMAHCLLIHKHPDCYKNGGIAACKILKKNGTYKLIGKKRSETREKNGVWRVSLKEMGKRRLGKNNPIFRHSNSIEIIRKKAKIYFANKTEEEKIIQINRFKKAPIHSYSSKPTKLEKFIINLNIPEIKYTGNGATWVKFNTGKYKNPDFIILNQKKVIEIGDTIYWHTKEEILNTTKLYEEIGIQCLYLTQDDIKQADIIERIKKFVYNHNAILIDIKKLRHCGRGFRYNLEIEDNHNYIANNILVSNCHHIASKTLFELAMNSGDARIIGLTATDYRADGDDMKITAAIGKTVYKKTIQEIVDLGYLVKPKIILTETTKIDSEPWDEYMDIYDKSITNNPEYHLDVYDIVKLAPKPCLILVDKIEHGNNLLFIPNSIFVSGQTKDRKQIFENVVNGKHDVIIATKVYGEGVNIPRLKSLVLAGGGKSCVKLIQNIGRVLRLFENKQTAIIYDFIRHEKYLKEHYKERIKVYDDEGFEHAKM